MLAKHFFGSAQYWRLSRVPIYRQEEARVILQGQYETRMFIAKQAKVSPEKVILPEF